MSDNPTGEQDPNTPEGGGSTTDPGKGNPDPATTGGDKDKPKTFTQEEVNQIVASRLEEQKRRNQAKADEDKAKEQGEWRKLAEQKDIRIQELEKEIENLKHAALRTKIGREANLPNDLIDRLVGRDEATLKEDAKKLAALVATKAPPNNEVGAGNNGAGGQIQKPDLEEAKRRKAASGHYS